MTDTYAEELIINEILNLDELKADATYEVATEFQNKVYYSLIDDEYVESDPQPESQEDIDTGEFFEITGYPTLAFPNESFEKPDDGYWYELYVIPAEPIQIELGSEARSRWIGIIQVNICVPKNSGREAINSRFDNLAKLFRSGRIIEGVRIKRTYRSPAMDSDDYYVLPVTIEWQADLDR